MREVLIKSLTLRGFINYEFAAEHYPAFLRTITAAVADGRIRYREDITDGLENAPAAFIGMLEGAISARHWCASRRQRDIVRLVKAAAMSDLIVLLHGSATGSSTWTPISAPLAGSGASFTVPDLIGYGRSPPPSSSYGIAESNSDMRDPSDGRPAVVNAINLLY
jgi:pimeloyl-ACP methyl ester carboxylesterase